MEVEVLGVDGVPKDAIISIRAGASRRQAPVSAIGQEKTPMRFSGGPAGVNPFKVDILKPIASARLAIKQGGGQFQVPIGKNGIIVSLQVREAGSTGMAEDLFDKIDANKDGTISRREFHDCLRVEGDKPVLQPMDGQEIIPILSPDGRNRIPKAEMEDLRFPAAATAAKEYLEGHKLLSFVRALLQTVVRETPTDPYAFIAEQFKSASYSREDAEKEAGTFLCPNCKAKQARMSSKARAEMEAARDAIDQQIKDLLELNPELRGRAEAAIESAVTRGGGVGSLQASAKGCLASAVIDAEAMEAAIVKARAQRELMMSLLKEKDLMQASQDGDAMQQKAREALSTTLVEAHNMKYELQFDEDFDKAKKIAKYDCERDILAKSLAQDRWPPVVDDDDDDDLDGAKAKARGALSTVLLGGGASGTDQEAAKAKARAAMQAQLAAMQSREQSLVGGNADSIRELGDARDQAKRALNDEDVNVEDAKAQARAAMLGGGSGGNTEEANQMAVKQRLLQQALGGGGDSNAPTQRLDTGGYPADPNMPTLTPQELSGQGATSALASGLTVQAVGKVAPGTQGDFLTRAEFTKASWEKTKDEMALHNLALKEQVDELDKNLVNLEKAREDLRLASQ